MKVCIVTTSFPRWADDDRGAFIFEAAHALQAQGAQVRVVAMHSPGAAAREFLQGVEVIRPPYLWPARLESLQREAGGLPIMWRKSLAARMSVGPFFAVHALATARYASASDVIHANWTLSAAAAWAGRFYHRRPIVATVQGSDIYQATHLPMVSTVTRMALNRCARVLVLSRSLEAATAALGVHGNLIEILPNGVDTHRFHSRGTLRKPLILYVGSLIERKGVRYLIDAMPLILRQQPDSHLVIVGDGPERTELERQAQSLQLESRIRFLGALPPHRVSEWMRRAQVFVLPSLEEGLGVVLLEALASGTPCVASRVGGIVDVISPDVGVLVPPASPAALAAGLHDVMADPRRWQILSASARSRAVEHFSWDVVARRLLAVYEAAVGAPRHA